MPQSLISRHPEYCGGMPRIRFHRLTCRNIKAWYNSGWDVENICKLYSITPNQVKAAINYGKRKKIKF